MMTVIWEKQKKVSKVKRLLYIPKYWEKECPTFDGNKHLILVTEDITGFAWSSFFKEKSGLKNVMLGLTKVNS